MTRDAVRSTLYLEADLHKALRLKAATAHRSMSEIVNDAIRAALQDDAEDLAGFADREGEPPISYATLLERIKADLRPGLPRATPASEVIERFRHLPHVDPVQFRADIDRLLDNSL